MKNKFTDKKTEPVPARGKVILLMVILLVAGFVTFGMVAPVWCITVNGEEVAVVASEEDAKKAIEAVVARQGCEENEVLDIQVAEDAKVEKKVLKNGVDPQDVMSAEEAEKELAYGNDGESYLTVVTTKEEIERELIEFKEEVKPEPTLHVGEEQVAIKGEEGIKEVKKVAVYENGESVEERVVEEELVKEPVEQVVLAGTKAYDGYGGSSAVEDVGVSYDEDATYEELKLPVDTTYVSSPYGPRWGRLHHGIDFGLKQGSNIYAADSGKVYCAGSCGGYGNLVKVDHGNGMQTYYAHCSEILVAEGQQVEAGEQIALVGSTGNSTGPHLHFEVIINGVRVDPLNFLDLD